MSLSIREDYPRVKLTRLDFGFTVTNHMKISATTDIIEWQEGYVAVFSSVSRRQSHSLSRFYGTNHLVGHQMAHHKLYTALDQHVTDEDCYEGYLWAPFDTFLNVPRLLQFNRNKIWYHSPFGVPVPNPALENSTQHAPPARISPDPYGNVTEIWKHWGRDWWFVLCGVTASFRFSLTCCLQVGVG